MKSQMEIKQEFQIGDIKYHVDLSSLTMYTVTAISLNGEVIEQYTDKTILGIYSHILNKYRKHSATVTKIFE